MLWAQKQKGFTIVELLIVVVVIAILAAITIVAYNGIQNRAKNSAAAATAEQAGKKIATNYVLNGDTYPLSGDLLTGTGLNPSSDTSTPYQYTVSSDQKTFCLTSTTNNISYYVTNSNSNPTIGACPGHNLNGVITIPPITNLITNPSQTTASTGWTYNAVFSPSGRTLDGTNWIAQGTRTSTAAAAIYIMQNYPITATPNTDYAASLTVTSSVAASYSLQIRLYGTTTALVTGTPVALAAGVPTRISAAGNIGANSSIFFILLSSTGTAGTVVKADDAMLTAGSTVYNYADGNSPGWSWSGTADNSTSSGPPL